MKRIILVICLGLILTSSAWAWQPAIIGGARDGLAIGLIADEAFKDNIGLRVAAEANTGKNPVILAFGTKIGITRLSGQYPLSLGLGIVGYLGSSSSQAGVSISFIFDNVFNVAPLFIEAGIDIADSGRLQAQLGYRF